MWQQRSETLVNMRVQRYNKILEPVVPQLPPGQNVISFFNTVDKKIEYASLQAGGGVVYNGVAMSLGQFMERIRPYVMSMFEDVSIRGIPLDTMVNCDIDNNEHDYEVHLGKQYFNVMAAQKDSD